MDDAESRRLYGEKDVSRILKRATELQDERGEMEPHGLTLAELQQIAREVGIAPEAVAAAAAELREPERRGFHLHGAPTSFSHERVVAGEVSGDGWDAMLDEIRRAYRMVGVSDRTGHSLEWTHSGRYAQAQVTVTARDGRVRFRIAEHYPRQAAIFFGPFMALFAGLMPALFVASGLPAPLALALGIALFGVVFVLLRFAFAAHVRRKEQQARALMHRLERLAAAPPPTALTASTTAALASTHADTRADTRTDVPAAAIPLPDPLPDLGPETTDEPPARRARSRRR